MLPLPRNWPVFPEFPLASVSPHADQVDLTQNREMRELRVAPLLAATCARQKARYVYTHVRGTPDDARVRFVLCVTGTSFPGGGRGGGLLTTLQIAS